MKRKFFKHQIFCLIFVFILNIMYVPFHSVTSSANSMKVSQTNHAQYSEDSILVKFKKNATTKEMDKIKHYLGLKNHKKLSMSGVEILKTKEKGTVKKLIDALNKNSAVEYAEPDYWIEADAVTNDPRISELWGLDNTSDIDIDAPEAWNITAGSSEIIVGVIDTGIDINHPELASNIWINKAEIAGDGIDNDQNGFIDDVNGWDFYQGNNSVFDSATDDRHGTHVAGTIAAAANNGIGVAGVAPNVKIMPIKFIGPSGGFTSDAIEAIEYAKKMGVRLLNNSWGNTSYSQALRDTINSFDGVFVAAAGNDNCNTDTTPHYPSSYDCSNIISVAALNKAGTLAYFSNYGLNTVDVAAPGDNILSTLPSSSYGLMSGTSMAAPHVTGIAALLMSANSSLCPTSIIDTIRNTTTEMSSLQGKVSSGGLVNANNVCMNAVGNGPFVAKADPVNYSTEIPVNKILTFQFQENVQASEAFGAIQLRSGTITVPCSALIEGNSLVVAPASLATDTSYTLFIPANAVKNASGEGMKLPYNLTFTTVDTINPTITGTTPVDGAVNEPVYNTVYINFSEDIKAGPNLLKTTFNGVAIGGGAFGYSINKNVLRMNYYGNLLYNTEYKIMIPEGAVTDQVGNPLSTAYSFGFTTIADNVPPTVSYTQPFNEAVGVPANRPVMVYFNEFIKEGAEIGNVTLSNGSAVIPSVKYISSNSLQIIPQNGATLEKNTKYTVNIPAGAVVDMAENRLAAACAFSFTTSPFEVAELPIHVTDAVMDPTNPIIYMISKYDGKLCTVNTETGTTYTVALPYAPQSIDIGKGEFADKLYIGLFGPVYSQGQEQADPSASIAVYNKSTLALEKSMPITINPYDLVAGRDGYVYVTSASDQWTTMESYNMLTNAKGGSSGIRQMSYVKLHPTLNKIYAINTDVSPRDLSAYNISNGIFTDPAYPGGYDSPYHGDYALDEYFAIDPTGKYLFNGSGNIFQTTADKSTDMVYKGKVNAAFTAIAFDEDMNRFYTSAAPATSPTTANTNAINVYNGYDFSLSQTLPIAGAGNFIFKQGGKLLVLLQIAGSKNTGLQILDVPARKLLVKSTNPANLAGNVAKNSDVVVTFDDTISASSAYDRISMTDYDQKPLTIVKQISGNQLIIKCDNMSYNTKYYLNLPVECVKNSAGTGLDTYFGISFTTEPEPDTLPPDIKSTYPMDGGVGTKITDELCINYTELITAGSSYDGINLKDANNNTIAISKRVNGNSLMITPTSVLNYETKYILTVPAGAIMDGSKNATVAEKTICFTTEPKPDTTPPVISGTDPMNGATGIAVNKIIKVNFSENIAETNSSVQILLKDSNGNSIGFSKAISGNTLTITPLTVLNYETNYTVSIPAGSIKDLAGNLLTAAGSISFVTQLKPDTTAPVMLAADPVNGALDIAMNKVIRLNFSENILEGTTTVPISLKDSYGNTVGFSKTINGSTLTITPLSNFNYSTKFTLTIPAGAVKDAAGNMLANPITTCFTTQAKPDVTAPVVLNTSPVKYATNVPLNTSIKINYNENITIASADLAKITLKKGSTIIKCTVQISGYSLTIIPTTILSKNSTYTVIIPEGLIKDSSNNVASALTFSFTTVRK